VIYFIQDSRSLDIKIGFTGSGTVNTRLNALQTGNASRLEVVACVPGTQVDEAELHRRFADSRVGGEWFRPTADLLRHLAFVVVGEGMYEEGRERGRKDALECLTAFVTPPEPKPQEVAPPRPAVVYKVGQLLRHDEYGVGSVCAFTLGSQPCLNKVQVRFPGHGLKVFLSEKAKFTVVERQAATG
jgi:hypothetical protein